MPSNEEHAQHTYRLYGIWAHDLHRWIDAPSKSQWNHRRFRHNVNRPPPLSAIEKYGYDMARKIQIAHFKLDGIFRGSAPKLPIWQEGDCIYKRMPNGKTYKKQLNGKTHKKQLNVKHQPRPLMRTRREKGINDATKKFRETIRSSTVVHIDGISISFSVKPQPKSQPHRSTFFTCPRCEGGVEVDEAYTSGTDHRVYPKYCVYCGYDLRGACLVASERRKEWVKSEVN